MVQEWKSHACFMHGSYICHTRFSYIFMCVPCMFHACIKFIATCFMNGKCMKVAFMHETCMKVYSVHENPVTCMENA